MNQILNQIKNHFGLATNAQALAYIQENCNRQFPNFEWQLPIEPTNSFVDCYDCNAQIMQRFPAGTPCPEGWISSPVSASRNTSNNPCKERNVHGNRNFGTTYWQPISFYNKKTGGAIGDPVLQRGGSIASAVNKKIGNFNPNNTMGAYERPIDMNTSMLTKGYPINSTGIQSQAAGLANPVINPNMRVNRNRVNRRMPKKNWLQRLFS